jgi:hypothetical protein
MATTNQEAKDIVPGTYVSSLLVASDDQSCIANSFGA